MESIQNIKIYYYKNIHGIVYILFLFFIGMSEFQCTFSTYSASQLKLATFHVLHDHVWLLA